MNTSDKLASARCLGVAAHARGLPRKPILDIDNLKELFGKRIDSIPIMEAWLDGWDRAWGRIPNGPVFLQMEGPDYVPQYTGQTWLKPINR